MRSVPPEGGTPTSTILELDVAKNEDIKAPVARSSSLLTF
jgi:hypothetical protein